VIPARAQWLGRTGPRPAQRAAADVAPHPSTIRLPPLAASPEVSILVLSDGRVDAALRCIASIAAHPPCCPVEIVVVAAPGLEALSHVANLRRLTPPPGVDFARRANWAVAHCHGAHVHIVSADAELLSGATESLLRAMRSRPRVGLVGSKLVEPDGGLLDAGGAVWADGRVSSYGRFDDADRPEYNFLREADFVSGVSMLVARALWKRRGGFDDSVAPDHYEPVDCAGRVRREGYAVLYQPASVVAHREADAPHPGAAALHMADRQRLRAKWADVLALQYGDPGGAHTPARLRLDERCVVLAIDASLPRAEQGDDLLALLEALSFAGAVAQFWPEDLTFDGEAAARLQEMGVETFHAPWETGFARWLAARGAHVDLVLLGAGATAEARAALQVGAPHAPLFAMDAGASFACARSELLEQTRAIATRKRLAKQLREADARGR
jgi:hypothetical protein